MTAEKIIDILVQLWADQNKVEIEYEIVHKEPENKEGA